MKGYTDFVVAPSEGRYDNKLNIDGVELILNTELQNHSYVSRVGLVISEPYFNDTSIRKGDLIILHHNVFRRFRDIRGKEKNSRSFYEKTNTLFNQIKYLLLKMIKIGKLAKALILFNL
tara:strand:- start:2683 stop:3039 length:357 start_codon:yes stop_codon:yes gene_type:complete